MKTNCKYWIGCGNSENCANCKGYEAVKVVYCVGAKWFDRVNGNTYNNVKVIDGFDVSYLGYEYGYGFSYRYRAEKYFDEVYGKGNYTLVDLGAAHYKKSEVKNGNF